MKRLYYLFLTVITSVILIISSNWQSVSASDILIQPTNPQLGDTIAVIIPNEGTTPAPTVEVKGKTYPSFPLDDTRYRAFIPTSPLDQPSPLSVTITQGETKQTLLIPLKNRSFPTQRIRLSGSANQEATQMELDRVAEFKSLITPVKYWNGPFQRPSSARVSTGYGIRRYYNGVFAQDYYHRGVDYAGTMGSPVVSPADGVVRLVGYESQGFRVHGNVVGIDHGQGVLSIFMHLSRIDVQEGDTIKTGQRLGAVGATGASTGPHLHWGLYVNGIAVDPVPWRTTGFY